MDPASVPGLLETMHRLAVYDAEHDTESLLIVVDKEIVYREENHQTPVYFGQRARRITHKAAARKGFEAETLVYTTCGDEPPLPEPHTLWGRGIYMLYEIELATEGGPVTSCQGSVLDGETYILCIQPRRRYAWQNICFYTYTTLMYRDPVKAYRYISGVGSNILYIMPGGRRTTDTDEITGYLERFLRKP